MPLSPSGLGFFFLRDLTYFCFACVYVSVPSLICLVPAEETKVLDPLDVELHMVLSCLVDSGN